MINQIIAQAIALNASDIHLSESERVAIRVNGTISFLEEFGIIPPEKLKEFMDKNIIGEHIKLINTKHEHDFSFVSQEGIRFRCIAFFRNNHLSLSMRRIEHAIRSMHDLGVPQQAHNFLSKKHGLILISGPAGSGKSTTMAAMINWINENKKEHIITIEDPIEYHIESKNCRVTQRELHSDTLSLDHSLRSLLRLDPNVIAIGEMRDRETIDSVLKLCTIGHLVISTIHTSSAAQSIYRILNAYPYDQKELVLSQLSESLIGVINQRLVPTKVGGRTAVFEVMTANPAVKSALRRGDTFQMENSIATGPVEDMVSLRRHAEELFNKGYISHETLQSIE